MGARRVSVVERVPAAMRVDYVDAFEVVSAPDGRTAEQRARDALEGAPRALRGLVVGAQRGVLRLRLGPLGAPGHVLGWRVVASAPDVVELDVDGPWLRSHLVARTVDGRVRLTTFIAYERPAGRWAWAVVAPVHRAVAAYLVARS